jgi:serine/threonine-protein kinase
MIGRTFAHYRIIEPLAQGGMGVVYRAWDTHLEREVAVKILPPHTLADESARKRFRREALMLSRLNHPHVNTVYDFDRSDGVDFIVMELLHGETLEGRLARGPMTEPEARRIASQIAAALAAAHEKGIIHRDLKPSNVMVSPSGDIKVLDFGVAKHIPDPAAGIGPTALTESAALVGTVPYMAPEQILGGEIDQRADLFALGAVLYEMTTGVRPFRGDTLMALANAIVNQHPDSPRTLTPGLSSPFEGIILRCLEKAPANRFPAASDVIAALLDDASPPESTAAMPATRLGPPKRPPRPVARRALMAWGFAAVATAALVFLLWGRPRLLEQWLGASASPTIAVLPLENLSRDPTQDFFADGMTEELTTALSKISALTVIAARSARHARDQGLALPDLARKLGARMIVEGTVARAGERVRVNARLVEASSGKLRWSNSYARDLRNILELQGDLALAIANEIQVRLTAGERTRISKTRRVDPKAHEAYLLGLHYLARASAEEQEQAIQHFQRAAALDPGYAAPPAAAASAYFRLSTWWLPPLVAMPKARAAARRALELDPDLAEAHAIMGLLLAQHDWQFEKAVTELTRAIALNPSSAEARFYLGYVLNQQGRYAESRRHFLRAVELDPLNSYYRWNATWPLFYSGRYAETRAELEALIRDDPKFADSFTLLGETYEQMKDYPSALIHLKHARELGMHAWGLAAIGRVYARMGQRDSAQAVIRQLESARGSLGAYVSPYGTATIHAALGEEDRAFSLLEHAIADRSEDVPILRIDPRMAPLRDDPRFERLLERVGLGSPRSARR